MPGRILDLVRRRARRLVSFLEQRARAATWPHMGLGLGALADHYRSRQELVAENQLLRQQVILLRRQISKPRLAPRDRVSLVLLASRTKTWAGAMLLVKPDTILRWHREGFRLFWKHKSRSKNRKARVPQTTIALIRQMARNNKLWGAERIRGELLKLGIRRAKTTIQRYMRAVRGHAPRGQSWKTFIHNQGLHMWSCDFLQTYDVFFRPIFAFFIIEIGTRRVVHVAVTRSPTSAWTAQQLRNATGWGDCPKFLVRDGDKKFGTDFDNVARGAGTRVIVTPYKTPNANAHCERLLGSVRRECLDHHLIVTERQMLSVLTEYCDYHNHARPHQGIDQRIPQARRDPTNSGDRVVEIPILGGLHHDYRLAA